ncbi:TRAP transporter permease [Dysosmobacter sp. HCP28S3_G4]|uniref:TRAP transporter permease n=1 Tax=Dysosmobacter sp. HCP28S3_G4 TaxID=3438938 RepID=UPI003F8BCF60
MALFKKNEDPAENKQTQAAPVVDDSLDVGTAEDVEAMMKKYDRESNVRIWEGTPKLVIRWIMIAFSVYCIWTTLFSKAMPEIRLNMFLGLIIIMGYLTYPMRKGNVKVNSLPWYDIVLMAMGAFPFFWYASHAQEIIKMSKKIDTFLVVLAIIALLSIFELCRRSVGVPILCVAGVLILYAFFNIYSRNPDIFKMFRSVMYALFYSESGVRSTPINVCAKYIVVFIIFGAFLERTGISAFFIDLANSLCGSTSGGPAKVAVVSSALCGMVSGSSVGNTVTTGSVTIPMMKKTGYHGEFAGAVEAASSTGGQIMPPIMGAAAFLMAEYMGIPYAQVALKAILPAVLYFTGIYVAVHLEARKLGLKGIPKEELPKFGNLIKKIYLLLPLVVLVWIVSTNTRTMQFAAAVAILVAIAVGIINKDDRITFTKILDALEAGGKGTITVAVACSMAGCIAGCITVTGLASKLLSGIMTASMGIPFIALVLTMLCCIVLGMGVPTTANYCIMASTCAPILIQMGFNPVCAHFFCFYFGIVADITPPVALAAYAGAAIAKSNPMKTAFNATRLAIAAFIVPYMFCMNPAMLFVEATALDVVQICITSVMGIFGVAAGLSGFLYKKMNPIIRLVIILGGLTLMYPGLTSDVIGLVLIIGVIVFQKIASKKETAIAA